MISKRWYRRNKTDHAVPGNPVFWITIVVLSVAFYSGSVLAAASAALDMDTRIEERWGVTVESIRSSANGHLIDFRYRIKDPDKAVYLVDRRNKPYLVDQESGKVLSVPTTAKVGPLRATVRHGKPKKDRVYFVLFGNSGLVHPGDRVSVVIGDFRVDDLVVE